MRKLVRVLARDAGQRNARKHRGSCRIKRRPGGALSHRGAPVPVRYKGEFDRKTAWIGDTRKAGSAGARALRAKARWRPPLENPSEQSQELERLSRRKRPGSRSSA
jgi:hypothetical protein